jgi:chloride channel 7
MFGTLEEIVEHLFSRDTHLEFSFGSLFAALPFYFFMICWATGTSVACGALVPML